MRGLDGAISALSSQLTTLGATSRPANVAAMGANTGLSRPAAGAAFFTDSPYTARQAARMPAPWELQDDTAMGGQFTGGGAAGSSGNAALDQHNAEFNQAMQQFGAPANLLKAMVNRESSGAWERDGARVTYLPARDDYILPFVGITKKAADAWGLNWNAMIGNKQEQINGMAKIVSGLSQQYGGYDNAIKVYFGGPQALQGNWNDENGLGSDYYYQQASSDWKKWDSAAGASGELPTVSGGTFGNNSVIQEALSFVGTPYVWGSIPGASQDPRSVGWDCSGMTYWLDQKYGTGTLPQGSHYQYQYAQQTGKLFTDTSQLQAGDLVFWDTGNMAGGGAELNRAGHVAVYIGNGQILHAANPSQGTIVSNLNSYLNTYGFLGAMHQSFSGGAGGGMMGLAGDWSKLQHAGW